MKARNFWLYNDQNYINAFSRRGCAIKQISLKKYLGFKIFFVSKFQKCFATSKRISPHCGSCSILEVYSMEAVFAHLPTQVVCRQWLKKKYSFVSSANHEMQQAAKKMSSHQSRDTKSSDRLSQGPLKIWTEHFNKSHLLKDYHGVGPGEPYMQYTAKTNYLKF